MSEEVIMFFVFGFCLFLLGLMFLYGYFHNSYKRRFSFILDFDQIFFKDQRELIRESDTLAFWICILMSLFTVGNGVIFLFIKNTPNISMIFICIGFVGSWFFKYVFLIFYKNYPVESIPKFWPRIINSLDDAE